MAKPFFPFEETIIFATGLLIGAIAAAGLNEVQSRSPQKPGAGECFCNDYDLPLNNFDIGRFETELTLEVLI